MYQKQTNKLKSLYTHKWSFLDKKGKEIQSVPCTAKEKQESVESYKKEIKAFKVIKIEDVILPKIEKKRIKEQKREVKRVKLPVL